MAAEGGDIIRYTYRGEVGEIIPREATHIFVCGARSIIEQAIRPHWNIVEVICHDETEKIEEFAFYDTPLRRMIMPGVKEVERDAFQWCKKLSDLECGKLEIIGEWAFSRLISLRNLNLPSARIVEEDAIRECDVLKNVTFGGRLERIEGGAFLRCTSLERITIPLKDGIITIDNTFAGCDNLRHVDLVEREELHEMIAALQLEEWKNDMNETIDSINQILPTTPAGDEWDDYTMEYGDPGQKAWTINTWIRSVLRKIIHYKAEHRRILNEAAATLKLALPSDILMNSVLPFLELPSHSFAVEDSEEDEDDEDLEGDSEEDSEDEGEEEEDHLGEERYANNVGQEEDQEEYDEDETAQRGRDKRQRR